MRCDEIHELAGAYALRALPRAEAAEVERHLAGCERHPLFAELRVVAESLAFIAPEREPSPELKARLMDAVRGDIGRAAARSISGRLAGAVRRFFGSPIGGYGLAAALAVAMVVLLVANPGGGGESTLVRSFTSDGATGRIVVLPDEKLTVLTVDGLRQSPPGRAYQVWAIRGGGAPKSIGFLDVPSGGSASAALPATLSAGETLAVTLEPAGGSPAPTTLPVIQTEI